MINLGRYEYEKGDLETTKNMAFINFQFENLLQYKQKLKLKLPR
jgi:hypothetical protein